MTNPFGLPVFARFLPFRRNPDTLALGQQVFFADQQVAERSEQVQPVHIFGHAAVAHLAVTKDLFDVPERMFHLGSGFEFFGSQLTAIQLFAGARALGDEPGYVFAVLMLIPLLNPKISDITEHTSFVAVQQLTGGHDVVNIGRCGIEAVDQVQCVVHADVHLHAKVSLIAFLGLVHFRVALASLVFGGTRGRNNDVIDDAAFMQHQAIILQMLVYFLEQHLAKAVAFQEMTEFENGGFVRQAIQLQAGKAPHGFNLVQIVFHCRIAEVVIKLHAMNPKHSEQRIPWPASLALGVITGYLLLQLLPGNQLVHPFQKDLAAGFALLVLIFGFEEGDLFHDGYTPCAVDDGRIIADSRTYSESP